MLVRRTARRYLVGKGFGFQTRKVTEAGRFRGGVIRGGNALLALNSEGEAEIVPGSTPSTGTVSVKEVVCGGGRIPRPASARCA